MSKANLIKEKPQFISPVEILKGLKIKDGDVVIDYGSGPGHWTIPAAKMVTPSGLVFAIDNNAEILNIVKGKAEIQKLSNIEIEELNLEKEKSSIDQKADLVIVANILHLIKNKDKFIERAVDMLKDNGKLLLVDWLSSNTLFGPVQESRLNEEDVLTICENANLQLVCSVDAGWHHFGFIFNKSGSRNSKLK